MFQNFLRRSAVVGLAATLAGGAMALSMAAPAQAQAAPGDLEICHGSSFAVSAAFPDRGGLSTAIPVLPWGEWNCNTFDFDLREGEPIELSTIDANGNVTYVGSVSACGGGHRIWTEGDNVMSLDCG